MSNKVKDIDIKSRTHYYFNDMINIKILIQIMLKQMKGYTKKYPDLLHWVCDDQTFKIR